MAKFDKDITYHSMLNEQLLRFYSGFRRDAHPMAVSCGIVGALSAFYHDSLDFTDPFQRVVAETRLIAKMPTIVANAYKSRSASLSCTRATTWITRRTSCN